MISTLNNVVYSSEVIGDNLNPEWKSFIIKAQDIMYATTIQISCIDFDFFDPNDLIWKFQVYYKIHSSW
jgi:hypothetical protein